MVRVLSRLLLTAALALAVTPAATADVAPTAAGSDIAWETLPYYGHNTEFTFFSVPTNAETFDGRLVSGTGSGFSFQTTTPEQYDGKTLEAIWKPGCPATKPQRVTLSRTVYLPGAPAQLLVNLQVSVPDLTSHRSKNPIAWAELRINGTTLARVERGEDPVNRWSKVDASDRAGIVRSGANTITVVAQKSKTPKSWDYCWQKPQGVPAFGVAAEVFGVPQADVLATVAQTGGSSATVDLEATITNNGPSATVGRTQQGFAFEIGTESGSGTVTSLALQSPAGTCTTTRSSDAFHASCPLPDLLPHHTVAIQVHITITGACPYSVPTWYRVWGIWSDPDSSNNGGSGQVSCGA